MTSPYQLNMRLSILPNQGSRRIKTANLVFRLLQLLLGLIVIIIYIALGRQLGIPLSQGRKAPVVSSSLASALRTPQSPTTLLSGHSLRSDHPLHHHSHCIPVHPYPLELQGRCTGVRLVRDMLIPVLAHHYTSTPWITTN